MKEAVYKLGLRGRSNGYEPLSGVEWRWDWNGTIVLVSLHSDDDDSFDVGRRKRRKPVLSVSISREQWARMDAMAADSTRSRFLGELIDAEWTRRRAGQ